MTRFWDDRMDRVTRLLELLSPLATQVKIFAHWECKIHTLMIGEKGAKKNPRKDISLHTVNHIQVSHSVSLYKIIILIQLYIKSDGF